MKSSAAQLFALLNAFRVYEKPDYRPPQNIKKCLNCGKEHTHNNSWCSAECCKEYRSK